MDHIELQQPSKTQIDFHVASSSVSISPQKKPILPKKRVVPRNKLLEPLHSPQQIKQSIQMEHGGLLTIQMSAKQQIFKNSNVGSNSPMNADIPLRADAYTNSQSTPNLFSNQVTSLNMPLHAVLSGKKQKKTLLQTNVKQNRSICKHNINLEHLPQYTQEPQLSKKSKIKKTLKEVKSYIPNDNITQMTTFQRYRNRAEFMDMLNNYPHLTFYEKLHLNVSGIAPKEFKNSDQNYHSTQQKFMSKKGESKHLKEKNELQLYQQQQWNKYDKDLPKPILDTSSMLNNQQESKELVSSHIGVQSSGASFSSKERKMKMKKILHQLKQQLISMVNEDTSDMPTQSQIMLMKGFLQRYLKQHEIAALEHEHFCNLYQAIIEQQDQIIKDMESRLIYDLLMSIIYKIPLTSRYDNANEDPNGTFSSRKFSQPQPKERMTFQQAIDSYKQQIGTNYESWQNKLNKSKSVLSHYQKINFAQKEEVIEQYLLSDKVQQQSVYENIMPSIERPAQGINLLGQSSLNFTYGITSQKDSEQLKKNKPKVRKTSPHLIIQEKEDEIGLLKRKQLLLEHVVLERTKSLQTLAIENNIPKKTITSNVGNSTSKTRIDVDFMELERYLRQRHTQAGQAIQFQHNN